MCWGCTGTPSRHRQMTLMQLRFARPHVLLLHVMVRHLELVLSLHSSASHLEDNVAAIFHHSRPDARLKQLLNHGYHIRVVVLYGCV